MAVARYRPDHDITFDLSHGLVHLEGAPARVLLPADALGDLLASADPAAVTAFGRAVGRTMGLRVAHRLAKLSGSEGDGQAAALSLSIEMMVDHFGAELQLAGLGSLGIERWGRALVVIVDHCPIGSGGDPLLKAAISEAIVAMTGRKAHAVLLSRDGVRARFLLANEGAAERVRGWISAGTSWGEALTRLHDKAVSEGQQAS